MLVKSYQDAGDMAVARYFQWGIVCFLGMSGFIYWYLYHTTSMMQPDSGSYIGFATCRTIGYPLFLSIFNQLFGHYDWVPIVQLILLLSAMAALVIQFYCLSRSRVLSMGLLLILVGNIEIVKYAFLILTESLTMTLLMLGLASVCQFNRTQKSSSLAWLSLFFGLAFLVRPASYGWIAGVVLLYLLKNTFSKKYNGFSGLTSLTLPIVGCMMLGLVFNYFQHGFFKADSSLGEMLIGKVGLFANKYIITPYPQTMESMAKFSEPVLSVIEKSPNLHVKYLITAAYYDTFRYGQFAAQLMNSLEKEAEKSGTNFNQVRVKLATDIIKAEPAQYIRDVLVNYLAIWQIWGLKTKQESAQLTQFLQREGPLPWIDRYPEYVRRQQYDQGHWLAIPIRVGLTWVFCITILVPLLAFIHYLRRQPISQAVYLITAASGVLQGAYWVTVLVQEGMPRYALVMWPAIALIGISSFWLLGGFWKLNSEGAG